MEHRLYRRRSGSLLGQDGPAENREHLRLGEPADIGSVRPCVARSLRGFVQQIAVGFLAKGYRYYVTGKIPAKKLGKPGEICASDLKLIGQYGANQSPKVRSAEKTQHGRAGLVYIRWNTKWVMLATPGEHPFFLAEGEAVRDIHIDPLLIYGYVISKRNGYTLVDMKDSAFKNIKERFLALALLGRGQLERLLEAEMRKWAAYEPVKSRWSKLITELNKARKAQKLKPIARDIIPQKRWSVRVFAEPEAPAAARGASG